MCKFLRVLLEILGGLEILIFKDKDIFLFFLNVLNRKGVLDNMSFLFNFCVLDFGEILCIYWGEYFFLCYLFLFI